MASELPPMIKEGIDGELDLNHFLDRSLIGLYRDSVSERVSGKKNINPFRRKGRFPLVTISTTSQFNNSIKPSIDLYTKEVVDFFREEYNRLGHTRFEYGITWNPVIYELEEFNGGSFSWPFEEIAKHLYASLSVGLLYQKSLLDEYKTVDYDYEQKRTVKARLSNKGIKEGKQLHTADLLWDSF